ncbi:MAG: hypothetical protein SGPRY_002560 [Prymnesium sp.]
MGTSGLTVVAKGGPGSQELLLGVRPRVLGFFPVGPVHTRSSLAISTPSPLWTRERERQQLLAWSRWRLPTGHVLVSSEDFFEEGLYPLRSRGEREDSSSSPPPPPISPNPRFAAASVASLASAYRHSTVGSCSHAARMLLRLFSGSYDRTSGLGAFLHQRGIEVDMVDFDADTGVGEQHVILNQGRKEAFFIALIHLVTFGANHASLAAPPSGTVSLLRVA